MRRARHGTEALECLRGRKIQRLPCGPPSTHQRGDDAEQTVDAGRRVAPLQLRLDAREIAAAKITAEQSQCESGERRSQRKAEQAADDADHARFGQHQHAPLLWRDAEHGDQCKLRSTLRHAEREHGIDQKSAREQRYQRQHGEVHAVGAREVVDALCGVAGHAEQHIARPVGQLLQLALNACQILSFLQLQVDAAQVT